MDRLRLRPDLSHCICTVAKREYWDGVSHLLQTGADDPEIEEKIELLRAFLETFECDKLRRESEPYMARGQNVVFEVYWQDGRPAYEVKPDQ
ncbi:MAG: hypothetical protein ACOC6A_04940 [Chloroflexota bacterium]